MKILIIGAGLIGLSSAYFLKKAGHDVKIIERQPDVALETSFANGGQISASYSEPWSNFSNVKKMLSWIGKEDSPLLIKPKFDIQQMSWFAQFLKECLPKNNEKNIQQMVKLAIFSRQTLQKLRREHNLQYSQKTNGILTFYRTQESFENGKKSAEIMTKFGCERLIKTKEECYDLEPALLKNNLNFSGADYTPSDESGDAYLYCQAMKSLCLDMGVEFIFNTSLEEFLFSDSGNITHVILKNNGNNNKITGFDSVILCAGSYTSLLANKADITTHIYPAKGYSATLNILPGREDFVNSISLTDSDNKIVFTRLNNKLRVAGTAEFNGYNLDLNQARCEVLTQRANEIFPNSLDTLNPQYWTGLRPSTPGNVPIIGRTKTPNLYINSGHGTLGWTMAAGSGKLIQQVYDNRELYGEK